MDKKFIEEILKDRADVTVGETNPNGNNKTKDYFVYNHRIKKVSFIYSNLTYKRDTGNKRTRITRVPVEERYCENTFCFITKPYGSNNSRNPRERILVIGDNVFQEIIDSAETLDSIFDKNAIEDFCSISNEYEHGERTIKSIKVKVRDAKFRENVFGLTKPLKCALCNCSITDLLEAAHIKGHEVCRNNRNDDDPKNGIVLCRMHHKLYDVGMIEIDINARQQTQICDDLKNDVWYEKYNELPLNQD